MSTHLPVCYLELPYLTRHSVLMAANALVGNRLDNCNSSFRSILALDLRKLQCVQNSLDRIVTIKHSHITPVKKTLHWLPIKHHSIFKTALLVYKFLHSGRLVNKVIEVIEK